MTAAPDTVPSARQVTALVAVLSLAVFMSSLDLFIVNLAFPYIGREYHGTSLSSLSWVLNGYTIVFAAVLVPAGRWADRVGRRRVFVMGLAGFGVGSLLCGVAPGVAALIAARVIQAVGAGLMVPASLSLLLAAGCSSAGGGCSGSTCRSRWPRCCWPAGWYRRAGTPAQRAAPTWPGPGCWPPPSGWSPWPWSRRLAGGGARPASSACCSRRWPAARAWWAGP